MFYILEKLDLTLGDMLRKGQFKPEQTKQFIELFERLIRSNNIDILIYMLKM